MVVGAKQKQWLAMRCSKEVDKQGRCSSFVGIANAQHVEQKVCARGIGSRMMYGWTDSLSDLGYLRARARFVVAAAKSIKGRKGHMYRDAVVLWADIQEAS